MTLRIKKPTALKPMPIVGREPPSAKYPEFPTANNPYGFGTMPIGGTAVITWYNKDTGETWRAPHTGYRPPKGQEDSWTTQKPTNWEEISAGKPVVEGWGKRPEPEIVGPAPTPSPSPSPAPTPSPSPSPSPVPPSGIQRGVPTQTITVGGARISDQGSVPAPNATIPQDPRIMVPTYEVPGQGQVVLPGMAMGGAVMRYNKGGSVSQFDQLFFEKGKEYGVDPMILKGIASVESNFNPKAVGPKTRYGNAQGMMQFIPAMQKPYGISDPFDPEQSVTGAARMMSDLLKRYKGDVGKALEAYNGGPRLVGKSTQTRTYAEKVQRKAQLFAKSTPKPTLEVAGTATQGPSALARTQNVAQQTPKFNAQPKTGELTASLDDLGDGYKAAMALTYLSEDDDDGLTVTERAEKILEEQEADSGIRGDALSQIFTMEPTETAEASPFDVYAAVQNPKQPEGFADGGFVFGGTSLPGAPNPNLAPVAAMTPEIQQILESLEPMNQRYEQEFADYEKQMDAYNERVNAYNKALEGVQSKEQAVYNEWLNKANAYNTAVDGLEQKQEIYNAYADLYNKTVIPSYGKFGFEPPEFNTWANEVASGKRQPLEYDSYDENGNFLTSRYNANRLSIGALRKYHINKEKFLPDPFPGATESWQSSLPESPGEWQGVDQNTMNNWMKTLPTKPAEFKTPAPTLGYDPAEYETKLAPFKRAQEDVAKYGKQRALALDVVSNSDAYNLAGFGMAAGGPVVKMAEGGDAVMQALLNKFDQYIVGKEYAKAQILLDDTVDRYGLNMAEAYSNITDHLRANFPSLYGNLNMGQLLENRKTMQPFRDYVNASFQEIFNRPVGEEGSVYWTDRVFTALGGTNAYKNAPNGNLTSSYIKNSFPGLSREIADGAQGTADQAAAKTWYESQNVKPKATSNAITLNAGVLANQPSTATLKMPQPGTSSNPPTYKYTEPTERNPYGFMRPTGPSGAAITTWYNSKTGETWDAPGTGYVAPSSDWSTKKPTNFDSLKPPTPNQSITVGGDQAKTPGGNIVVNPGAVEKIELPKLPSNDVRVGGSGNVGPNKPVDSPTSVGPTNMSVSTGGAQSSTAVPITRLGQNYQMQAPVVPNLSYGQAANTNARVPIFQVQDSAGYGQAANTNARVPIMVPAMSQGGDARSALDKVRQFLQALDVTPLDALYAAGRTGAGAAIGLTPSGLNEGEDELLARYRAMAERERSTTQPPMARSEGSPPYGEDVDMQMFGDTGDRSMSEAKKGFGRSVDAIRRGVQYSPADLLGAPVDVINMGLQPFGLGSEKPFMGSEYLIDKGVQAGIYEKPTGEGEETLARFAAGMINPTLGPRAVGKVAEGIETLGRTPPTGAITPQPIQSSYLVPSENKPFVSNVERFVLDLPDKVTKQQVLGQFKKLGRKHEIARLEMALEDFPDNARLDTTQLLARLEQNSPRRYTTEIIEPDKHSDAFSHTNIKLFHQTDMPFSFNFDTQQTRNVGSVNLLLDPGKEQSELMDAALTLKDAKYMLSSVDMFLPSKESYAKMDQLSQAVDVLRQYDPHTAEGMSSVLGRARQLADKSEDIVKLSNAVTSPNVVNLHELTFNQGIPRDQAKLQLAIEPAAKLQKLLLDLNVGLPGTNYAEFDNLRLGMREGRVSHDQVKEFVTDVLGKGVENEIALVKDQLKAFPPLVMPRFNKNLENVMPYMGKPQHTDIAPRNPISFSRFTDLTPDEVTSSVPFEKGAMAFSELQSDRWSDLAKAKKLNKDIGIEEPFPNMADNYGLVQQLAAKNAIYAAVKRDKDMVLFPSVDSKKPELYEGLLPSLKAVVKDLGPGFRLAKTQVAGNRPIVVDRNGNILEVKYDEPPIERWGIKIEPEGAERIKSEGIRFAKGGMVDKPLYDRAA